MKKNLIVIFEGIMFAIFTTLGSEITQNSTVDFSNYYIYIKIVILSIVYSICIYFLYHLLSNLENKQMNIKQDLSLEKKKNHKKYVIIFIIFLICWIPLYLAVFPGYFCYDAQIQYEYIAKGEITKHHPILHTILLGGTIHLVYLLTGSYNAGIAIYTILQMIIASAVFTYSIYFMEKYNVSKFIKIIGIIWYALFPTIQMFVLNSSKDTLFSLVMLLLIMCLIDMFIKPKEFISNKRNIDKFVILVILFCALRNNAIYAFVLLIPMFFFIHKEIRKKVIIISILACIIYEGIFLGICEIFRIKKAPPGEAYSVPMQQIGYVYKYNKDTLTEEEKQTIKSTFLEDDIIDRYDSQVSDPIKVYFNYEFFHENIDFYIKLGIKYPSSYINAFLINTVGFWYPNKIIDGYNKIVLEYLESKTSYFNATTEEPGTRHSFIPKLEEFYFRLSREGIMESIPVISWLASIGAHFWLVCLIIGYSLYKKRCNIVIPLMLIVLIWGTMLFGPMVLVRYMLILFFIFPLNIALLLNNKKFQM